MSSQALLLVRCGNRCAVLADEPEKSVGAQAAVAEAVQLELKLDPAEKVAVAAAGGGCEVPTLEADRIRQSLQGLEDIQWHDITSYEYHFSLKAKAMLREKLAKLAGCSQCT